MIRNPLKFFVYRKQVLIIKQISDINIENTPLISIILQKQIIMQPRKIWIFKFCVDGKKKELMDITIVLTKPIVVMALVLNYKRTTTNNFLQFKLTLNLRFCFL